MWSWSQRGSLTIYFCWISLQTDSSEVFDAFECNCTAVFWLSVVEDVIVLLCEFCNKITKNHGIFWIRMFWTALLLTTLRPSHRKATILDIFEISLSYLWVRKRNRSRAPFLVNMFWDNFEPTFVQLGFVMAHVVTLTTYWFSLLPVPFNNFFVSLFSGRCISCIQIAGTDGRKLWTATCCCIFSRSGILHLSLLFKLNLFYFIFLSSDDYALWKSSFW